MKNLLLAITLCVTGVFTPPNYLTAQATWIYESQNSGDVLAHSVLQEYQQDERSYFDPITKTLVIGTTIYNQTLNTWEILIQGIDKNNGANNVVWDYKFSYNPPYQAKHLQLHSLTGNFNQIIFTSTLNQTNSIYGPVGEFFVTAIDINTGLVNWNYNNSNIAGGDFMKDVLIKTDANNDYYITYLRKYSNTNTAPTVGMLKLSSTGQEIWSKAATFVGNTTILKLFDLDYDYATNMYIVCGLFDHGGTQKGIFTIRNNPTTGVFDPIIEMLAATGGVNGAYEYNLEDYPAMIAYDDNIYLGFEGTQLFPSGNITETGMAKFAIVNGVQAMTLLKKYSLPTGKSKMRFIKIIKTNPGIKALFSLVSNTNNKSSWAVADVNPTTLDLTNFKEYEFLAGVNEEFPIDIVKGINEIFVLSRFMTFNGIPNGFRNLKLSNITQLNQNPDCFPVTSHVINSFSLLLLYKVPHITGNISFSEGADDSHMYPFEFDGYEKDCMGNVNVNYKTSVDELNDPKSIIEIISDAENTINYTLYEDSPNLSNIQIYSIDGKLVKSLEPAGNQTIDIRSFEAGSYITLFTFENGFSKSYQFIKL